MVFGEPTQFHDLLATPLFFVNLRVRTLATTPAWIRTGNECSDCYSGLAASRCAVRRTRNSQPRSIWGHRSASAFRQQAIYKRRLPDLLHDVYSL